MVGFLGCPEQGQELGFDDPYGSLQSQDTLKITKAEDQPQLQDGQYVKAMGCYNNTERNIKAGAEKMEFSCL